MRIGNSQISSIYSLFTERKTYSPLIPNAQQIILERTDNSHSVHTWTSIDNST